MENIVRDRYSRYNRRMKRVRVSIEWNYGCTASMFRYLNTKRKFQILKSSNVSKIYTVATLLRNISIGYYGCQSSNYFNVNVSDNFVQNYINQIDF
jgi:hypothetical protein